MRFLLSIIFLLPFFYLQAQQDVDSLIALYKSAQDNEKVDLANEISFSILFDNPEEALEYADEAFRISSKSKYFAGKAESLLAKGKASYYLNNNEEAKVFFHNSATQFQSINDLFGQARANLESGRLFAGLNQSDSALYYLTLAQSLIKTKHHDALRAEILLELGNLKLWDGNYNEAKNLYEESISLLEKEADSKKLASTYSGIADYYSATENHLEAIAYLNKAMEVLSLIGDQRGVGIQQFNIGNSYFRLNNFPKAINSFQSALEIFLNVGFERGVSAAYEGIGLVYEQMDEYNIAIENYEKSLLLKTELKDQNGMAQTYNNIAIAYIRALSNRFESLFGKYWEDSLISENNSGYHIEYQKAMDYSNKSVDLYKQLDNLPELANAISTRAKIYIYKGQFEDALTEILETLKINRKFQSIRAEATNLNTLAKCYEKLGQYEKARESLDRSLELSTSLNSADLNMYNYSALSSLAEKSGDYRLALDYYKHYSVARDSFMNESKLKAVKDAEIKYETKAKEQEIVILNKDNELKETRLKIVIFATIIVSILLLIAIRLYVLSRRQKRKIEFQKLEIDKSIQAGKDIQETVLPKKEFVDSILDQYFILFHPASEVSGDFYWIAKENGRIYVLTADCTGHGIPGAFVSMLGVTLFREVIDKHPEADAGVILDELKHRMIRSMQQTGEIGTGKSGMDVSFYILDESLNRLDFAGAKNPLLLIRNGEQILFKADRMPIGIQERSDDRFVNQSFELEKGDTLFTFSDGFPDQFGGPKGEKYKIKYFKEFLASIAEKSISEMHELLEAELIRWKGKEEQNDDILVIGVKI